MRMGTGEKGQRLVPSWESRHNCDLVVINASTLEFYPTILVILFVNIRHNICCAVSAARHLVLSDPVAFNGWRMVESWQ
jgi:hypothetical protein